jgi:serine phosphatase RsbU (regulator of sigma subunit)
LTRIHGDTLSVTYSYCMTRFSKLVAWFKDRQRHLRDHRALFRAAPKYGAVFGVAPLGVFLLYYVNGTASLLLVASLLAAVGIFATTFLFFMTVGSLVYDNEEKAYRLEKANTQLRLYADWIRGDLDRARAVQEMLLPDLSDMPLADRLEWGASFVPEEEVGGDYFDTFQGWTERGGPIEDFIRQLNSRLYNLTPRQSFAAVAVGILDLSSVEFTYCNCGHNPEPYVIRADGELPAPLDGARNLILGALEEISPVTSRLLLCSGDTVFFATDGITEASNPYGEEFAVEGLEQFLSEHRSLPVEEMVERLISDVESHSQNAAGNDDRAVLAFRVR